MLSWLGIVVLLSSIIPGFVHCYAHNDVEHMGLQWKEYRPPGVVYDSSANDCTTNRTLFRVFFKESSFDDAEANCRTYNGHLASFHSLDELKFINEVVNDALFSAPFDSEANRDGYYRLWAGAYHLGEEATCNSTKLLPKYKVYFVDGTDYDLPMDEETQQKIWYQSCCKRQRDSSGSYVYQLQPDNYGYDNEFCGAFKHFRSNSKLRLGDKPCRNSMKAHVCKYEKATSQYQESLPWKLRYYG